MNMTMYHCDMNQQFLTNKGCEHNFCSIFVHVEPFSLVMDVFGNQSTHCSSQNYGMRTCKEAMIPQFFQNFLTRNVIMVEFRKSIA